MVTPRSASRFEIAAPMPRIPPVTSATCPVMSAMGSVLSTVSVVPGSDAQDEGLALAAAAAQAGRADPAAPTAELERQVQGEAGAGGPDRVAHRDRAAVDVDDVGADVEVAH